MELRDDVALADPDGDELEDIRRHFGAIMAEEEPPPVDVRAYLLDPPPTPEEAARQARRRLLVRRGSIAASVVIAIVLLVPWPAAQPAPAQARSGTEPDVEPAAQAQESELPVRVDAPVQPAVVRSQPRRQARSARHQRRQRRGAAHHVRSAHTTYNTPAPAPAVPTSAPAPASAPGPSTDAGVLTPVI